MTNKSNNYNVNVGGTVNGNLTIGENNQTTLIHPMPVQSDVNLQELVLEIQSLYESLSQIFPKNSCHENLQKTKEAIQQNESLMEKLKKLSVTVGIGAIVEAIGQPLGDLLTEIIR